MPKYRIYIDEVGNPDLESSDNPNHRFLSLTGAILELGYVQQYVHPEMEAIKARFFRSHPDDPVILLVAASDWSNSPATETFSAA